MSGFNTPGETGAALLDVSVKKGTNTFGNLLILGFLAGAYVAFGAQVATVVMSDLAQYLGFGFCKFMGGAVFSIGLILVILAGAELFTGNSLVIIGYLSKRVTGGQLLRNWLIVYLANFLGSLFVAYLMYASGLWQQGSGVVGAQAITIANAKVNLAFGEAITRGILCNWLVCLAVWLATAAKDVVGKIAGIIFPIMAFVACGFEHSIANMYFIPMGIFLKGQGLVAAGVNLSNLTWSRFLTANLIPVTIGNLLGGVFFVGVLYWFVYVRPSQQEAFVQANVPKGRAL